MQSLVASAAFPLSPGTPVAKKRALRPMAQQLFVLLALAPVVGFSVVGLRAVLALASGRF